jgi:predicted GNAT superfamily acetyltransferase
METEVITIRRLANLDEYSAAEQLQQDCWQSGPIEAVPSHLMLTMQYEAGLVLGAFTPPGRLVGFVLGFLGREGVRLKHCSHMAAVLPAYRRQNIAYRLKMAQRDFVRAEGLDLVTWTYDPLQFPNAMLNIARLGAISRVYKRNVYGLMRDELNGPLPTDRLYVRWEVTSARVAHCAATGTHVVAPVAEALLTEVSTDSAVPRLIGVRPIPDTDLVGIQIPRQLLQLRDLSVETALEWRLGIRDLFEAAFAAGFSVVNATPDPAVPDLLGRYTLKRET